MLTDELAGESDIEVVGSAPEPLNTGRCALATP